MGLTAAVILALLSLIPLLGGLFIAAVAPIMLASVYLSLDVTYRHNAVLPAGLRKRALKQSPMQLWDVFRNSSRVLPTAVTSLLCAASVLIIHLLVRLIIGEAWVAKWSTLGYLTLSGMLLVSLIMLILYAVLAATVIYSLPLTFLRDEPLVPSIQQSLKASRHFAIALVVPLGVLLIPLLFGLLASTLANWAGYLIAILVGAIILPVVSASLFCSYRDIFTPRENHTPVVNIPQTDTAA